MFFIFVADITGGTETFYLDKKSHKFALIEVSMRVDRVKHHAETKPMVTYGTLRELR